MQQKVTTPLDCAAINGHLEICRLIIDAVEDKNPSNGNGKTPLHWAAENGHAEVVKLMLDNVTNRYGFMIIPHKLLRLLL